MKLDWAGFSDECLIHYASQTPNILISIILWMHAQLMIYLTNDANENLAA